jgi:hypothetical protein
MTLNTCEAPAIDEVTQKVATAGGRIVTLKAVIPGVGFHARCTDTKGIFSRSCSPISLRNSEEIECLTFVVKLRFKCWRYS